MYIPPRYHKIFIDGHPELGLTKIPEGWCIHHRDGNHYNDEPDNLQLMTIVDHTKLHMTGRVKTLEEREKHRLKAIGNSWHTGYKHTEETRKKMRDNHVGCTGIPCSEEKKRKISEAQKGKPLSEEHLNNIRVAGVKRRKYTKEELVLRHREQDKRYRDSKAKY